MMHLLAALACASPAHLPYAGEGGYNALLVIAAFDQATVSRLLPPGLSLAPQHMTPAGTHPMVFAFGNQSHVRPIDLKLFDVSYSEFIHGIPYTQFCEEAAGGGRTCRGPFLYCPKLYAERNRRARTRRAASVRDPMIIFVVADPMTL